ncbi:MAG: hypothetical protein Ta2C_05820 [Candidatus Endomicrobiellum trichonymphae]|nr:MAG: hypothetical protein Ta2C_05820 [Candidatus Endomicrobium trichonymphae]
MVLARLTLCVGKSRVRENKSDSGSEMIKIKNEKMTYNDWIVKR